MSNLLKSKFFFGVMVVVLVFVGVAAVGTSADAACSINSTLRVGSTGAEVVCLQTALGGLTADGNFGPMTKAAVMQFQSNSGLVADGVFGPMSRAVWLANNSGAGGTFPAGCTSNAGYSTTTGMSCAASSTLPAGCTSTSGYSVTTGMSCSVTTDLPAGCSSTSGYSPTTGAKCDGSAGGGSVSGGAGSITVTAKSTYSNEEVIAGDEDAKVMAFEVEADDGSDVDVTSVKVELKQTVAGNSKRIYDYIDTVSVWMGSTKVGEADAADFSETSNIYTKSISLDGAVVDAGETEVFTIAVTALGNLDSGDINDDSFGVDVLNVRFEDGEGVVTTEETDTAALDRTFDFDDLASSGDLELKLSSSTASPDASSVEVDATTTTDVTMLEFKLKAEGSDMLIDALELTGVATDVDDTWADMVSSLTLEADGDEIDSISAYGDGTDDDAGDLWFTSLDYTIAENDTVTFKVVAKIRAIAATSAVATAFDQGDSFTVSFPTASLDDTTNTDVEDSAGDTVAAGDRTGSAVGETQTFYSSGVMVTMGTVTYETITDGADTTQVTYNIPLTATSFGDTRYVGLSAEYEKDAAGVDNDLALAYELQDSTAPTTGLENGTVSSTFTCSATVESGTAYRLDEGVATNCTLQVIHTTPGTASRSYRVQVNEFQTYTDAALNTSEVIQTLTPVEDFQTGYKFITG